MKVIVNYGKVSIIMPAYNTGERILDAINSIVDQTYKNWELIIVDDCSTDNTMNVIKSVHDDRIIYFKNKINMGAAYSRNRAIREAKGNWISFLDSDDLWFSNKLELQLNFMVKNDYDFTFTDYIIKDECGRSDGYRYFGPDKVNKSLMWRYCYFSTITVIYNRKKIGLIQIPNIKKNNDYAMWLKIIENTDAYRFSKILSVYWKREGSISSGNKLKLIKYHYILFKDVCNCSSVYSIFCTLRNLVFGVHKKIFYRRKIEGKNENI